MKSKKRLIIISSILATILLFVILSSAIFSFKEASVEYETTTKILTEEDKEKIIKSAEFDFDRNILFINYDKNIAKIEKSMPYVKVVNIERTFPSSCIVHVTERQPAICMTSGNNTLILDKELKVLNVVNNLSEQKTFNLQTNEESAPTISLSENLKLEINRNVSAGDKVNCERLRQWIENLYNGCTYGEYNITFLKNIDITYKEELDCTEFIISFDSIDTVAVIRGDDNIYKNIQKVLAVIDAKGGAYRQITAHKNGEFTVSE